MQRYFLRIGFLIVVLFLSLACFSHVFASGKIKAEDFSYQKISLGDPEANIQKQWGEPDFENTQSIWGIHLKTFYLRGTLLYRPPLRAEKLLTSISSAIIISFEKTCVMAQQAVIFSMYTGKLRANS